MSALRGLVCDGGCGRSVTWSQPQGGRFLTKTEMEKEARRRGWHAPDRMGSHWCWFCRSETGRDLWRRRENIRLGLPVDYGRGKCECKPGEIKACSRAGHPGVIPSYPGWKGARNG